MTPKYVPSVACVQTQTLIFVIATGAVNNVLDTGKIRKLDYASYIGGAQDDLLYSYYGGGTLLRIH